MPQVLFTVNRTLAKKEFLRPKIMLQVGTVGWMSVVNNIQHAEPPCCNEAATEILFGLKTILAEP